MINDHHPKLHLTSLKHAWSGFYHALLTQRNFRLEIAIGVVALLLAYLLQFDLTKQMIVLTTILLVLGFEMVNSSVEAMVDEVHPDIHPRAKASKDAAAAAMLLISFLAGIVGLYLFLPPLLNLFY
jgi:diacylglycerol kinase (ATP)